MESKDLATVFGLLALLFFLALSMPEIDNDDANTTSAPRVQQDAAISAPQEQDAEESEISAAAIEPGAVNITRVRTVDISPAQADQQDINPEDHEYIILQANRNNNGYISIDGWTLRSTLNDGQAVIGAAGVINSNSITEKPVILPPGGTVVIVTGDGPYTGFFPSDDDSFRVTKCTGYLSEKGIEYIPSLRTNCPDPEDKVPADIASDSICMEEVIEDIGNCEEPAVIPYYASSQCGQWVRDHVGYPECVSDHREDDDFLLNQWRLYLDRGETIWEPGDEIIELVDPTGTVIDTEARL